jgi:hypothetical protein
MITLTDYDGFAATYQDDCFITVTPYSQGGVAGSKIEYLTNTYTIAVAYVTSTPATISGSSVYVQPLTIVLDNGQTETFYLNPRFYKSYTAVGSNTQLIYEYDQASQPQSYITSTSTGTIDAQIAAATGGGGLGWGLSGNAGTDYTVNYIGTTDNEPLTFRTNGIARFGFDETGGTLSTTDLFNPAGSYSVLQWGNNSITQKIYVLDVNAASIDLTSGSVVTLTEDTGTGIYNQTIVSLAEILLSASGTGTADIRVYPSGEIAIVASDNLLINGSGGGNVGIGSVNPEAVLDVASTESGFLPPRMTGAERDLIDTPVNGMILYNTTTDKLQVRAAGAWVDLH